ncbi:hypothetical protein D8674_016915 [Pyrus ussuriensis x Pyrus communis]|uniref:Uncharacterized protein n=1 Tax=Pyrus ussuriensis x Pyrus communis TaxID=2448454 RepID=A0A5N5HBJ4_9ROSA|nr:hypothetical protein D8674_016915 [Pyrus ussuriensis x Pyrus communis]
MHGHHASARSRSSKNCWDFLLSAPSTCWVFSRPAHYQSAADWAFLPSVTDPGQLCSSKLAAYVSFFLFLGP